MIRCAKCEKSKHFLCQEGKCECNCRRFADTTKAYAEGRLSDPALDPLYEDLNKQWKQLHEPTVPEPSNVQ